MGTTLKDFEAVYGFTLEEWIGIGGNAGEYMQNYTKWVEDPVAFYTSQPTPYHTIYDEVSGRESNSDALPDVNREVERIKKQAEDKDKDQAGYFKLGTVELTIPPIQISVSDIKHNTQYKTLRTKSDIIFQSGKATKIIELDIYFHNIDEINNKLRPLLAQLKCMPFIPIYSEYLTRTIAGGDNLKYVDSDGKEVDFSEKLRNIDAEIDKSKNKLREAIRKNKGLLASKPNLIQDLNSYWDTSLDYINDSKLDQNKSLTENINNMLIEAGVAENVEDDRTVKYQADLTQKDISFLGASKVDQFNEIEQVLDEGNLVGVLSQVNVGTVAGFPESLACHMTLFLFNYEPFSSKFEYLDASNNPTIDIDKCTYFIQWYTTRFLMSSANTGGKYYKELDGLMDGEVKISYFQDAVPLGPTIETDTNSVCSSIMVTQKNSIAFLPVLQWSVPTCQYLGSYNAEIILTFDTIDNKWIDKLKDIFNIMELQSRTSIKARRQNFLTIDNELLAFMGIQKCALRSMDTSTVEGAPGMSRVSVKLVEFDVKQLNQEQITERQQITDEMSREFFLADIKSFFKDKNNVGDISTFSDNEIKSFRTAMTDRQTYLDAAGYSRIIHGDISFSAREEVPGLVPFRDNKSQLNKLVSTIRNAGFEAGISGGLIYVRREGETGDAVPYTNKPYKEEVAQYLQNKVSSASGIQDLENYELDTLLWNTPSLREYRESRIRDRINSYLSGHASSLPENVRKQFESAGLTDINNRVTTVYPDMDLPTYSDTKKVGVGAEKPSYSRLGTRNPLLRQGDSPRIDGDLVEPDFCFVYESLGNKTYLMNDNVQVTLATSVRDAWRMMEEDFNKIVKEELPMYVNWAAEHLFETPLTTFPIDDLLDDKATEESDTVLNTAQQDARSTRDKIQQTSLEPTSPEENRAFQESTGAKSTLIPKDEVWDSTTKYSYTPGEGFKIQSDVTPWSRVINNSERLIISPPGYSIYDKYVVNKAYSDESNATELDSGKNVYGGIVPDSSFNEEIREHGQSLED